MYGFNGTLVGLAAGVLMHLSWLSLFLMVVAASASTVIARLFSQQRLLPGFTMPFILAVWLLTGLCSWVTPDLLLAAPARTAPVQAVDWLQALVLGVGQVMFMDKVLAGVCFLAAILVHSRRAACHAVLGALLPVPLAILLGVEGATVSAGLMGYNGVLCAIALGDGSRAGFAWATGAVCLSVVLQIAGLHLGLTTLTAPFVLSVWFAMGLRRVFAWKTQA